MFKATTPAGINIAVEMNDLFKEGAKIAALQASCHALGAPTPVYDAYEKELKILTHNILGKQVQVEVLPEGMHSGQAVIQRYRSLGRAVNLSTIVPPERILADQGRQKVYVPDDFRRRKRRIAGIVIDVNPVAGNIAIRPRQRHRLADFMCWVTLQDDTGQAQAEVTILDTDRFSPEL